MRDKESDFTWFFRAEYESVLRSSYLVLQDRGRAEEVTQEAFAILYRRWRHVSRYDRPDAWVRTVAIRLARRQASRDRLRARLEHTVSPSRPSPEAPFDTDLMRTLAKLPHHQRAAIVLFYLEDRPTSEIASILDCSETTARVHLHKARKRLAFILNPEASDAS